MPPVFIQFSNLEFPVLPIGQLKLGGLKCPINSKHYLNESVANKLSENLSTNFMIASLPIQN